jgi:altered-inheritance-of-mitochondria protein 13
MITNILNPQTDSTRAKTLELHIQARVAEELKRLQAREDQLFKDLTEKLSSDDVPSASDSTPTESKSAGDALRTLGREAVQKDVQELKKKLEARKKVVEMEKLDSGVMEAREEVVRCLRGNDRRPLDCWAEVERFREEVRRMEERWVERVVR